MSEEIKETDAYKIFRKLEERKKRANPYTSYDKDELIDEILKQEDEIDRLNNIINELEEIINYEIQEWKDTDDELMKARVQEDKHILEVIEELKENK